MRDDEQVQIRWVADERTVPHVGVFETNETYYVTKAQAEVFIQQKQAELITSPLNEEEDEK
jgi:hypothetical protein